MTGRLADADERVILVDPDDQPLGSAPKLEVHRTGALHRALSVFVTDGRGNVLLQRRAAVKYHSPGLWSNTCCGHPRPGEATSLAAARRLADEMGVFCALEPAGTFLYRATLGDDLVEHEIDHVYVGRWTGTPHPDPDEVEAWRWVAVDELPRQLDARPAEFTAWLRQAFVVAEPRLRAR